MKISRAESAILEVLWKAGRPVPAEQVVAALEGQADWSAGTVRTFLTRLVKKKAAAVEPDGRRYLYRPVLDRADYVHEESRGLIDRLFGGRIVPFVTQLSERESLTREEIEELKKLVERLDRDC